MALRDNCGIAQGERLRTNDIKAVVFDLDDTLYPEEDYVFSGFRHVAKLIGEKYGIESGEAYGELEAAFKEGVRNSNFNVLLDEKGIQYNDKAIKELVAAYREHKPLISLPNSSTYVLGALKRKGKMLGLVTDGYLETQTKKVEAFSLEEYFDAIVYTDKWGKDFWKPHKRGFAEISRLLNVEKTKCCYVADNPAKDFKGANDCGMLTVQLLHWADRRESTVPEGYQPDIICDVLEELLEIFG